MSTPVVTVASGGMPVVDVTNVVLPLKPIGMPVTEAANGRGIPITKVVGKPGVPVVFVVPSIGNP